MKLYDVIKLKDDRIATIIEIHETSIWVEVENTSGEYEILMLNKEEIDLPETSTKCTDS